MRDNTASPPPLSRREISTTHAGDIFNRARSRCPASKEGTDHSVSRNNFERSPINTGVIGSLVFVANSGLLNVIYFSLRW